LQHPHFVTANCGHPLALCPRQSDLCKFLQCPHPRTAAAVVAAVPVALVTVPEVLLSVVDCILGLMKVVQSINQSQSISIFLARTFFKNVEFGYTFFKGVKGVKG
jgi:hypothetical protein